MRIEILRGRKWIIEPVDVSKLTTEAYQVVTLLCQGPESIDKGMTLELQANLSTMGPAGALALAEIEKEADRDFGTTRNNDRLSWVRVVSRLTNRQLAVRDFTLNRQLPGGSFINYPDWGFFEDRLASIEAGYSGWSDSHPKLTWQWEGIGTRTIEIYLNEQINKMLRLGDIYEVAGQSCSIGLMPGSEELPWLFNGRMVPLVDWCRAQGVSETTVRQACVRKAIPGAVLGRSGKYECWYLPENSDWKPSTRGRPQTNNPSRSALSHRKRRAQKEKLSE